jgi:hypothetical protein
MLALVQSLTMAQNVSTPVQETRENIELREKNEKLEKELKDSRCLCNKFKKAIDNLEHENKLLKNTIEQFKDGHLQHLQCHGKLCAHNCTLCTILWIYQRKLGIFPCGMQLLILLYNQVAAKIKLEDLICHKLIMEIFIKCELVAVVAEYKYPTEENAKLAVIMQAWERIMTMDSSERVLILGRIAPGADGVGHAEVCDLETRTTNTVDGRVAFYNPQRDVFPVQLEFIDRVKNDRGLILYVVHVGKLNQIFTESESILHHTYQPDQTFSNVPPQVQE